MNCYAITRRGGPAWAWPRRSISTAANSSPDHVVLDMAREEPAAARAAGDGYVLDEIPRKMQQTRAASGAFAHAEQRTLRHCMVMRWPAFRQDCTYRHFTVVIWVVGAPNAESAALVIPGPVLFCAPANGW